MSATSEVPEGTISDVLDWVGDDPERAQAALVAERDGQNRSTLISQLESISCKEDSVSESTATTDQSDEVREDEDNGLAPGPEQPVEVELHTSDAGLTVTPVHIRDADVEVDEDAGLQPRQPGTNPDAPPQGDRVTGAARFKEGGDEDGEDLGEVIEGAQVETVQGAFSGQGAVILINGEPYVFGTQMVGALKQIVDQAVVGLAL